MDASIKNTTPDAVIFQMDPPALSVKQACAALGGIGEQTLRKWINRAGLPAIKVDNRVIIPVDGMRRWLKENEGRVIEL